MNIMRDLVSAIVDVRPSPAANDEGQASLPRAGRFGRKAEVGGFQRLDYIRHHIGQLEERLDERAAIEVGPFAKNYTEGKLSVVCHVKWVRRPYGVKDTSASNAEQIVNNVDLAVVVLQAHTEQLTVLDAWNEQPMLVDVVRLAERPEVAVPSLVRLYHVKDDGLQIEGGLLYFSQRNGLSKLVPRLVHRKVRPLVTIPDNLAGNVVQRSAQVVDGIANVQSDGRWKRLGDAETKLIFSKLRFVLHEQFMDARPCIHLDEGLQVLDVLSGPSNL